MMRRTFVSLLAAVLCAGCGLTANTQIYRSDGVAKHAYRKIAVIAMSASKSERQTFDDAMVARLARAGVDGIVGDRYIEDAATANGIAPMDAIRAAGADGVIYVWLRAEGDATAEGSTPSSFGPSGAGAAWYPLQLAGLAPRSSFDVRMYDVATQGIAWSGRSATFYPQSLAVDAPQVADAVVGELVKRGFITGAR